MKANRDNSATLMERRNTETSSNKRTNNAEVTVAYCDREAAHSKS